MNNKQNMMKSVRVEYKVKSAYVEKNKTNISAVMMDLRENPIKGMNYVSYYLGEGKFMHLSNSMNEEVASQLSKRDLFNKFRMELKASEPLEEPISIELTVVGSNVDLV